MGIGVLSVVVLDVVGINSESEQLHLKFLDFMRIFKY